jgi:hypothetical protein
MAHLPDEAPQLAGIALGAEPAELHAERRRQGDHSTTVDGRDAPFTRSLPTCLASSARDTKLRISNRGCAQCGGIAARAMPVMQGAEVARLSGGEATPLERDENLEGRRRDLDAVVHRRARE